MSIFPVTADEVTVTSFFPSEVSFTQEGERYVRSYPGHRWEFSLTLDLMSDSVFRELDAFINSQRGKYGSFGFKLPGFETPLGSVLSGMSVKTSVSGGSEVDFKGAPENSSDVLLPGDFISFSSSSKVYMVINTTTSDPTGEGTIHVTPPLMAALSVDDIIQTSAVVFTVELAEGSRETEWRPPYIYSENLKLQEVV